jgi:effector-binding domain-containing protein
MIVRISGEDQYLLADGDSERLNELENAVVSIVDSGREEGFADAYRTLLDYVREHGTRIGEAELESSEVILPPPDLSFQEAAREFTGEGLIPD